MGFSKQSETFIVLLLLLLCFCCVFSNAFITSEVARFRETYVWVDSDPEVAFDWGEIVTVHLSGFEDYEYCRIALYNPHTATNIHMADASCKKRYMKFKMDTSGFFIVRAAALTERGIFEFGTQNTTVFQVRLSGSVREYQRKMDRNAMLLKARDFDYYNYDYYQPEGASVWIEGDPEVLGSNEHITISYTGISEYEDVVPILVDEYGNTNMISGYAWGDYVHFTKVDMPNSYSAYIKLWVMDPDTMLPLFYFTSENSYRVLADPQYYDNKRSLRTAIVRHIEKQKRNSEPVLFVEKKRDISPRNKFDDRGRELEVSEQEAFVSMLMKDSFLIY